MGAEKWEDTVMKAGDLCLKVCQEHRSATLEAKDCTGLDCEECQLKAQAEISFKAGIKEVMDWVAKENEGSTIKIYFPQAKLKEWEVE